MLTSSGIRIPEAVGIILFCAVMARVGYRVGTPRVEQRPVPAEVLPLDAGGVPVVRLFDDYQCDACERFDRRVADRLRQLDEEGRIRLLYYHTPLPPHGRSNLAAAAVACAPAARVTDVRRRLHRERAWIYDADPAAAIIRTAGLVDTSLLTQCMGADSTARRLAAEADFGRRAGIRSVPTVWVGNHHVLFRSYTSLLRHIEEAL
jgi:protein-disulfide isomerase